MATHRRAVENDKSAHLARQAEKRQAEAEERDAWLLDGLASLSHRMWVMNEEKPRVLEVRVKRDRDDERRLLAIVKVRKDGKNYVAFRSGGTMLDILADIGRELESGTLKLREDQPWEPPKAKAPAVQLPLPGTADAGSGTKG
jgi:hypothetical protein